MTRIVIKLLTLLSKVFLAIKDINCQLITNFHKNRFETNGKKGTISCNHNQIVSLKKSLEIAIKLKISHIILKKYTFVWFLPYQMN